MQEYTEILKYSDDYEGCTTCYHNDFCKDLKCMHHYKNTSYDSENSYYANKAQTVALIEEAETNPGEWVRHNAMFICKIEDCSNRTICRYRKPQNSKNTACSYSGEYGWIMMPYRGDKSEEETWPGKTGETHLEALKDLRERGVIPEATDEDCSEVEGFIICASRTVAEEDGCIDCNGGNPHKEWEGPECYMPLDFRGELDGVDYLKGTAGSCIVEKEDIVEMEKKYVVINSISIASLIFSEMKRDSIKSFININGSLGINKGAAYHCHTVSDGYTLELERCGFIEEKVEDYDVKIGECFKFGNRFIQVMQGSTAGLRCLIFMDTGFIFREELNCKYLSGFVGKDRLKEFKPVKVTITVEED